MNYLALDLGGSSIKYGILDEEGAILSKGKSSTNRESLEGLLDVIRGIKDTIEENYEGVAVSMPGRIETKTGIAWTGGAYRFIEGTEFGKALSEIFEKKVVVANDGKCAAAAELWQGSLADGADGAVIVLGSGIGGGIVLNHEVRMGTSSAAGEFSWIPVDFPGAWQPLKLGTPSVKTIWTGLASTSALISDYAERIGVDLSEVDGVRFFREYENGSADAEEAIQNFADNVAVGIFGLQSILDLDRYVIGGGISAQPVVTEKIRDSVERLWSIRGRIPFSKPEVVTAEFQNDANLIGALHFYLKTHRIEVMNLIVE